MTPEGYVGCGTKIDARRNDRLKVAGDILPEQSPGLTLDEILTQWPENTIPKPGKRALQTDLTAAFQESAIGRSGAGRKNDPYRFWVQNTFRARSPSIGARNELDESDASEREAIMFVESEAEQDHARLNGTQLKGIL